MRVLLGIQNVHVCMKYLNDLFFPVFCTQRAYHSHRLFSPSPETLAVAVFLGSWNLQLSCKTSTKLSGFCGKLCSFGFTGRVDFNVGTIESLSALWRVFNTNLSGSTFYIIKHCVRSPNLSSSFGFFFFLCLSGFLAFEKYAVKLAANTWS